KATRGAVHYPRRLIALFTEAIHLRNRHLEGEVSAGALKGGGGGGGRGGEALKEARAGYDRRLEKLAYPRRAVKTHDVLSDHLWNHLGEWFTFLSHPEVEPTNWEAEQALRRAGV